MSEQELKDLQIYIGKRNQNQTDNKEECLSETMINAGWFGETEIVKF